MIQGSKKIGIIELIRGIAAISVCLFHFSKTNLGFPGSSAWFPYFTQYGWAGVEAFFVVSGFVIPFSLSSGNYRIGLFPRFLFRRCVRIEPSYFFSIVLLLGVGYVSTLFSHFQGFRFEISPLNVLLHVFYLPAFFGFEWLQPVYWTLESEIHFYILMGLLFPFIFKSRISLLVGMVVGCLLSRVIPLSVFTYMPYFSMGMLVYAFRTDKINKIQLLTGLLLLFGLLQLNAGNLLPSSVGLAASLMIAFVEFRSSVSDFLGKISYSLYLIHIPVAGKLLNYISRFNCPAYCTWIILILVFSITIFAAWLFYRFVDRPFQLISQKIKYNK